MLDKPDSQMVGAGLANILTMFLMLPFFLLVIAMDVYGSESIQAWIEIGFHLLSCGLIAWAFRSHLSDSLRTARQDLKKFFTVTGVCLVLCIGMIIGYYHLFLSVRPATDAVQFGFYYTLPLTEKNLITYPLNMLLVNPIPTVLTMSVLTPVAISCLYYGCGFAPVCYHNAWLAYPAVALLIALPRLANCLTFRWINEMELTLYLTQLPLHFIACYSYQKTESIWAPIVIHSVVNLLGCNAKLLLIT